MRSSRDVSDVDRAVGHRIRARRLELKLSQLDVAQALGVAPQQVQKYERGANRVSASRLVDLCQVLDLTPNELLLGENGKQIKPDKNRPTPLSQMLASSDGHELAALFSRVSDGKVRRQIVELLVTFVEAAETAKIEARPKRKRKAG